MQCPTKKSGCAICAGCFVRAGGSILSILAATWMWLFSHLKEELGLVRALRVFWQGREIAKQNAAILKAQKQGAYWTHTGAEMAAEVTAAGFEIYRQQSVYRGYSDLLVCRAMA